MCGDLLGRIDTCQTIINEHRPFEDVNLLKEVQSFYRVGMVYSSNAIEGYTYTLSETKILLEDGLTAGGRPLRDAFAVIGHAKAYDYMFSLLHKNGVTKDDILTIHVLLGESLDNEAIAGKYRDRRVFITGSKYAVTDVKDIEREMDLLLDFVQKNSHSLHPVVLAAHVHKKLAFIHPFADGNGRVARLVMNTLLIQNAFLPAIIPPVRRNEYISYLEKAHHRDRDFVAFICECEIETQKDMIRLLNAPAQVNI